MDDGSTSSIQGYAVSSNSSLNMLDGSNQPLSGKASGKGTIDFGPNGKILVGRAH